VLLIENCSVHVTDDAIRLLIEARACVITFAPHTTQIFQVLDLTLFALLKRPPRYEMPLDHGNATVKYIMSVYHDFRQTMVLPNPGRAFHVPGLDLDTRKEPYRLLFDEEKLRGSACFRGLWSVDAPLDQLSIRRRAAWFGWINGPEESGLTPVYLCFAFH
jgi:hypothetical protein